ncbi:MAG: hypothetical protein PUK54_09515 [Firmicutes bacterium]|nr:hypothetical protein [Bacillota bacterium]MDD7602814.1 hypothetical protein [Bacillota bacterium]MDY5855757.1 hypothetical protein [Anaerovoracaceae bacterium]
MNLPRRTTDRLRKRMPKQGSYLVEAVLTLPLCILAVVALALIIRIISICQMISFVTACEMKDINLYYRSYMDTVSLCRKIEKSVRNECEALTDFKVKNVRRHIPAGGMDDLTGITAEAKFTVHNPAGIHGEIVFTEKLLTRRFAGTLRDAVPLDEEAFTSGGVSQKVLVYLRYGEKYHSASCSVVKREAEEKNEAAEMQLEDAVRKGYTACRLCGGGGSSE